MLRKFTALFLAVIMCVVGLPMTTIVTAEETTAKPTIIETSDIVMATQEVEGSTLACEYIKDSDKYYLCIDGSRQELCVTDKGDTISVTIADHSEDVYDTKIVAQGVTFVTYTGAVLTAAMIYAARDLIVATLQATVDVASKVINLSLNAILTTINNVKSGKITTTKLPKVKVTQNVQRPNTKTKTYTRTIQESAVKTIAKSKKVKETKFWSATISGGEVELLKEITRSQAIARLKAGKDVFTSKADDAEAICLAASPKKKAIPHEAHVKAEGYYYHFHPKGIKWYKNPKHQPHCWYVI